MTVESIEGIDRDIQVIADLAGLDYFSIYAPQFHKADKSGGTHYLRKDGVLHQVTLDEFMGTKGMLFDECATVQKLQAENDRLTKAMELMTIAMVLQNKRNFKKWPQH